MPINLSTQIQTISYESFHTLDYQVMGIAFSIHREMGRFWNEKIYQNELSYRCQKAGLDVASEVAIEASHQDFCKSYFIDLLINNAIYELKAARSLTKEHEKQTINYLMLTGLNYAKLLNFRSPSVQYRFVSTNLTPEKRHNFTVIDDDWRNLDEKSIWLKKMLLGLLSDWGAFLEVTLFYDALTYFLGGEDEVLKSIEVCNSMHHIGAQKVHLLSSDVAFKITSITKNEQYYEKHLYRFIQYTSLKAIEWINMNHDKILFKTILKH
ncbi:MAG: GxxExxY protein [Actinobacteria bacterium]|nr:GxxExxY protein [Actinomycetota bacterium]